MGAAIRRVYVEEEVASHPRTRALLARLEGAEVVPCRRYGEVFNRRAQSFRLQKRRPALILARKFEHRVLPVPAGYGFGSSPGYYFSHLLNCLYDCRYCFLQGMFRSAHYVLFVNYEDFQESIDRRLAAQEAGRAWFFSGYDCDSLALEPLTRFVAEFLPFFAARPRAGLELRTKSTQIAPLLRRAPLPNVVTAFSFTPPEVHRQLERGVPGVEKRLRAMERLAERGWRLGLRFDPLIWTPAFRERYRALFDRLLGRLAPERIHSVSLGGFRLPRDFYERVYRLYPEEKLFAGPLEERGGMVSQPRELEREMVEFCRAELSRRLPAETLFDCPGEPQEGARRALSA